MVHMVILYTGREEHLLICRYYNYIIFPVLYHMFTVTENQVVNYQSASQSTSALVEKYLLDYWKLD